MATAQGGDSQKGPDVVERKIEHPPGFPSLLHRDEVIGAQESAVALEGVRWFKHGDTPPDSGGTPEALREAARMKTSAVDANGHEGVAPAVQRRVNEAVAEGCELAPCESRRTASDECSGQLGCTGVPKPLPTFDPGRSPSDAEVVADSREHCEWFGSSPKFKRACGTGVRKRFGNILESYLHAEVSFSNVPTPTPSLYLVTPPHINPSSNLSSCPQP